MLTDNDISTANEGRRAAGRRGKPLARKPAARASRRRCVDLYLAHGDGVLHPLVVEQCVSSGNYMTVYRGPIAKFVEAGVPDAFFPNEGLSVDLQIQTLNVCCTGRAELVSGVLTRYPEGQCELEVNWGGVRPYMQACHPAIGELARMIFKDLMKWTDDDSMEGPFRALAKDPRASDYRPATGVVHRTTPEFRARLKDLASEAFQMVHSYGEVYTVDGADSGDKSAAKAGLRVIK